jgi:hypothetical protein
MLLFGCRKDTLRSVHESWMECFCDRIRHKTSETSRNVSRSVGGGGFLLVLWLSRHALTTLCPKESRMPHGVPKVGFHYPYVVMLPLPTGA